MNNDLKEYSIIKEYIKQARILHLLMTRMLFNETLYFQDYFELGRAFVSVTIYLIIVVFVPDYKCLIHSKSLCYKNVYSYTKPFQLEPVSQKQGIHCYPSLVAIGRAAL